MPKRSQEGIYGALHDLFDLLTGKWLAVGSDLFQENPSIKRLHEVPGVTLRYLNYQDVSVTRQMASMRITGAVRG